MSNLDEIIAQMLRTPHDVRFSDLCKVCDHYFGVPRQRGTSHRVYQTLWPGDPRVNIQNKKGKARAYQVKQVLKALARLGLENDTER
ncbi:MAG: toxin HicA [Deltaproteobacteria bacterium]|nr:MAG: toxin HicA [Deltaproteobacteria bacterium]